MPYLVKGVRGWRACFDRSICVRVEYREGDSRLGLLARSQRFEEQHQTRGVRDFVYAVARLADRAQDGGQVGLCGFGGHL